MKKSLMPEDYKTYLDMQVVRAENKWGRKPGYDDLFRRRLQADWERVRDYMKPQRIACMGCRDGTELFEFKLYYGASTIVGVDITENIKTIRVSRVQDMSVRICDFSNLPKDWNDMFDLVYSNSLDHAYNPYETIKEWHRVSRGHLFIQLATANIPNQIEHCFEEPDIPELFPEELFEIIKVWKSNFLNVFAKVKK